MRCHHILAALLLIASSGCAGSRRVGTWKGGGEITAPAERKALLDRFKQRYYDLREHSFVEADCDVHNSFTDEMDTC